jgi:hypothetical protein
MEVADILRAQGDRFLERYQSSFSNQQLKAFRAISRCRTAALGGHIDVCHHCGYEAGMSYKWIVYAKPPFGEPAQLLRYLGATRIASPFPITACWLRRRACHFGQLRFLQKVTGASSRTLARGAATGAARHRILPCRVHCASRPSARRAVLMAANSAS